MIYEDAIKLDYSLKTIEERKALVEKIIAAAAPAQLTSKYIEILGDYILDAMSKDEKKESNIPTKNRVVTINKRETSYEDLVGKLENGEDGIYNLISTDKNMYLDPKIEITAEDLAEIPGLQDLRDQILKVEEAAKAATGKRKYLLKKQAIEMRQQQYILKELFRCPVRKRKANPSGACHITLDEDIHFDAAGEPVSNALVNLFDPAHISAILCQYENLKHHLSNKYHNDFHYLMRDFDKLAEAGLAPYPVYKTIVRAKIAGKTNNEIQQILIKKHGVNHTPEYISSLWRKKIPKILAEKAKEDYIIWYYTEVEYGTWKRCSRCGEMKLAHNRFFSKNNTSKDGYYSICKKCRSEKNKEKK